MSWPGRAQVPSSSANRTETLPAKRHKGDGACGLSSVAFTTELNKNTKDHLKENLTESQILTTYCAQCVGKTQNQHMGKEAGKCD